MKRSYRNSEPRPPIMQGTPPPERWRYPRSDWDRPPWNRWSFQHICEILPTTTVRAGADIMGLDEAVEDIGAIGFTALDGSCKSVAELLDETYTDGFLVHLGGRVLHESYHNGMQAAMRHLCQSVSKSITASAAGILIGEGVLDLAATVDQYLPEFAATGWHGATLQQVLDMTSGTRFSEDYEAADSDMVRIDVAAGWRLRPEGVEDPSRWPDCVWDVLLSLRQRDAIHGERFEYRSAETDVLAHCMERAAGRGLAEIVSDRLWTKIGAEHDAYFTVDRAGYALADGGFNATLRDLARFGLVYLNEGRWNDRRILPERWVADIRRGKRCLFNEQGRENFPNGCYRNHFWVEDREKETVLCLGVFGQMIYIAPEYDMVAVKLSSAPDFLSSPHTIDTVRALHAIGERFRSDR